MSASLKERLADAEETIATLSELTAHIDQGPEGLAAGLYITMPQGHALLTDGARSAVLVDLGGVAQFAGINVTEWDVLDRLGRHLIALAARKAGATP